MGEFLYEGAFSDYFRSHFLVPVISALWSTAPQYPYIVTLNGADRVDPSLVLARMRYDHPIYTPESVGAQHNLHRLSHGPVAFAGAYHGWGFHEDGYRSGAEAAAALGVPW